MNGSIDCHPSSSSRLSLRTCFSAPLDRQIRSYCLCSHTNTHTCARLRKEHPLMPHHQQRLRRRRRRFGGRDVSVACARRSEEDDRYLDAAAKVIVATLGFRLGFKFKRKQGKNVDIRTTLIHVVHLEECVQFDIACGILRVSYPLIWKLEGHLLASPNPLGRSTERSPKVLTLLPPKEETRVGEEKERTVMAAHTHTRISRNLSLYALTHTTRPPLPSIATTRYGNSSFVRSLARRGLFFAGYLYGTARVLQPVIAAEIAGLNFAEICTAKTTSRSKFLDGRVEQVRVAGFNCDLIHPHTQLVTHVAMVAF